MTSSDVALIRSIRPRRSRARARINAPRHGRVSRGKGASARLLSSLPHYSIMMACGVCRTPFALIASAFSPPRCFPARFSPPLPPLLYNLLFFPRLFILLSFHSCFSLDSLSLSPLLETGVSVRSTSSFATSPRSTKVFVPRFQSSTRTHLRDDDVRDITPPGERESLPEREKDGENFQ